MKVAFSGVRDELVVRFGKSLTSGRSMPTGTHAVSGPLKPTGILDPRLRDIADELYRPGASIGNGGTGDAIRAGFGHEMKGAERITQIVRWLDANPNASTDDLHAAQSMLQDLISAMCNARYHGA